MDSLFGEGTSLPVRFFIAFVVVFALIGVSAWLIRRFGSGALGGHSARGRAPRLAVIEAGVVDGRRKLVLIRRDNIEHLLMIGGPTDIVVEANIVRSQPAREGAPGRSVAAPEIPARSAPPLEDVWPSEPAPRPTRPVTRPQVMEDSSQWSLQPDLSPAAPMPQSAPKRSRPADTLAGLAAELNVRPAEPQTPAPAPRTPPQIETPRAPKAQPQPAAASPASPATPASDSNLADMAQRLEAALRRPTAAAPAAVAAAATAMPTRQAPPVAPPKPAAETPRAAPPVKAPELAPAAPEITEAAPQAPAAAKPDDVFGSLEEEMANLLGRPAGKPS